MHNQPRPARYLSDLTPKMSTALIRCHTTIVLVGDHHARGISTPTIHALVRRDLIGEGRDKRSRKVWKPSHNGLTLIQTEEPRFLAKAADALYTTDRSRAMFPDAGEAVDDASQRYQTADAHDRLQGLPGRRQDTLQKEAWNLSRRLKQSTRSLTDHDVEAAAQLERIRIEIDRLEGLRAA